LHQAAVGLLKEEQPLEAQAQSSNFIPDKKLAKLFTTEGILAFSMAKLLSAHLSLAVLASLIAST
jgi:hypothetical protein